MKPVAFEGVFSVLPTPFTTDDRLDLASLERVVDLFLRAGVSGFTALGVTSEVARLSERERLDILNSVIAHVNGRVPVVAGTTAEGTAICLEYSRQARDAGAAAVMVSPPRMPKLNSDAVVRHYLALSAAVDIPIVVQDYPPISGYAMEATLLVRIAREVPHVAAIKLEDPPTPLKIARIRDHGDGRNIAIFGGLGGVYLLEEMLAGGSGAMTGFAFPEILVDVVRSFRAGEIERAAETFYRSVAVMRFEFQEGIGMAIRKEMLRRRGAIAHAGVRPPAATLDASTRTALDHVMRWAETNVLVTN